MANNAAMARSSKLGRIEDPVLDPRRPYDEGVAVPTSPPRVTRSPMVSPTMMDEGDVSHLPSLELSPIRQTASASSENSDERANSQCLPHRTPAKKLPRSQENTPRMKNSSNFEVLNELLVHASIVAKDVPQGGKGAARKPAGLPMTRPRFPCRLPQGPTGSLMAQLHLLSTAQVSRAPYAYKEDALVA